MTMTEYVKNWWIFLYLQIVMHLVMRKLLKIEKNNTQKPTNIPNSKKPIGVKWMYKTKGVEKGVVEAFKTLLSKKGG